MCPPSQSHRPNKDSYVGEKKKIKRTNTAFAVLKGQSSNLTLSPIVPGGLHSMSAGCQSEARNNSVTALSEAEKL